MSDDEIEIEPARDENTGVPFCSEDCRQYDGKRCRLLGLRPGNICEPAVTEMAKALTAERARRIEAERALNGALELIREYEAQWGDDYLAKKWDLKGQREAIEAMRAALSPETASGGAVKR